MLKLRVFSSFAARSPGFSVVLRGFATTTENKKYFDKILIANRGEIACRVIQTAKKLGIKTVAVYSEADSRAKHVLMADEAVCIGPAPSSQSYLCSEKIIQAMKDTGAQACHPGYGFLSENAAFSEALEKEGLVFIGPGPFAMRAMGDKIESKKLAKKAGVSVVPGVNECIESPEKAVEIARQVGYPVMIKASAGGGGKGMRIAWNDDEAKEGFRFSKAEAKSSFKDDRVFIEKFVVDPRHIEIQIMADKHGNAVWLNERECSIQRRNQKVIEEAPSVVLDPETRRKMGEQAVALAKAVGYSSAGTVEMMVDKDKNFYFLEMNTRLQVEHPVTEYITGLDLVEMMFSVAAGNPLSITQDQVQKKGWAMEARVYAEDPFNNFLPSIGRLNQYKEPDTSSGFVRADSGILENSEISIYYDPLIAKLVTYGETRDEAIGRMKEALDSYVIRGVRHNIAFLRSIMAHERFVRGALTTAFIKEEYPEGYQGQKLDEAERNILLSCVGALRGHYEQMVATSSGRLPSQKPACHSNTRKLVLCYDKQHFDIAIEPVLPYAHPPHLPVPAFDVTIGGSKFNVELSPPRSDGLTTLKINKNPVIVQVIDEKLDSVVIQYLGSQFHVGIFNENEYRLTSFLPPKKVVDTSKMVMASMPGVVTSIAVAVGQKALPGQEILVVEAMKMQNVLRSAAGGVVSKIHVQQGAIIGVGDVLVEFQ